MPPPNVAFTSATAVTVNATPQVVVPAADGGTSTGLRAGAVFQNQDATATIRLRFGSSTAAPYLLVAGATLPDTVSQGVVYADVASSTAVLWVSVIK